MTTMTRIKYTAVWHTTVSGTPWEFSFMASGDQDAIERAQRMAAELVAVRSFTALLVWRRADDETGPGMGAEMIAKITFEIPKTLVALTGK